MLMFTNGYLSMHVMHLKLRGSIWWYWRKVRKPLQARLGAKWRRVSLQTKDKVEAIRRVTRLASEDDALWSRMLDPTRDTTGESRQELSLAAAALLKQHDLEPGATGREAEWNEMFLRDCFDGKETLTDFDREVIRQVKGTPPVRLLSDALSHYLKHHDNGENTRFSRDYHRVFRHVYQTVGDKELTSYKRADAERVRDARLASGVKTGTVRRELDRIAAVFKSGLKAFDLPDGHPFEKLKIKGEGQDAEKRDTFTREELEVIAAAVRDHDDDLWCIIGMLVDTGARLAEIVGLKREDVKLAPPVPHMVLRPHPERRLKNKSSARSVPLVGLALWSTERALAQPAGESEKGAWLFPRYAKTGSLVRNDTASATLNKRLKSLLKADKVCHGLRHTMKDRLRQVGCPEDVQEALLGHGEMTTPRSYGKGYGLEVEVDPIRGTTDRWN